MLTLKVAGLFTEQLQNNECLLMVGPERFSDYDGYASTFTFKQNHVDTTPRDTLSRRQTQVVALDAIRFWDAEEQYTRVRGVTNLSSRAACHGPCFLKNCACTAPSLATPKLRWASAGSWPCLHVRVLSATPYSRAFVLSA